MQGGRLVYNDEEMTEMLYEADTGSDNGLGEVGSGLFVIEEKIEFYGFKKVQGENGIE